MASRELTIVWHRYWNITYYYISRNIFGYICRICCWADRFRWEERVTPGRSLWNKGTEEKRLQWACTCNQEYCRSDSIYICTFSKYNWTVSINELTPCIHYSHSNFQHIQLLKDKLVLQSHYWSLLQNPIIRHVSNTEISIIRIIWESGYYKKKL